MSSTLHPNAKETIMKDAIIFQFLDVFDLPFKASAMKPLDVPDNDYLIEDPSKTSL